MNYAFYSDMIEGRKVMILTGIHSGKEGVIAFRNGSNNNSEATVKLIDQARKVKFHCKNLELIK